MFVVASFAKWYLQAASALSRERCDFAFRAQSWRARLNAEIEVSPRGFLELPVVGHNQRLRLIWIELKLHIPKPRGLKPQLVIENINLLQCSRLPGDQKPNEAKRATRRREHRIAEKDK